MVQGEERSDNYAIEKLVIGTTNQVEDINVNVRLPPGARSLRQRAWICNDIDGAGEISKGVGAVDEIEDVARGCCSNTLKMLNEVRRSTATLSSIASCSWCKLIGLEIKPSPPSLMHSSLRLVQPVTKMILGPSGQRFRMILAACNPSISGIWMSMSTRL